MKFVDYVKIFTKAGKGGRGCVAFRREKFVPLGGPNGGDGGHGGSVIFKADERLNTLLDHAYRKHYSAENGQPGMGKNMHGKDGLDIVIKVPVGTLIKNQLTGETLADLDHEGKEALVLKGGRGGKGNAHFKSSTYQAPKFAQPGEEGEEADLILELKLLADVGLIGMPNAGKSTFLATVSSARPKIADYPFTTLIPNLGVVKMGDYTSFTIADIPGIIENAHLGAGLGLRFLRHAERTVVLLHLVDSSDYVQEDPVDVLKKIDTELDLYSKSLSAKPQIIVATKLDVAGESVRLAALRDYCSHYGLPFYAISAVTKEGVEELVNVLSVKVKELKEEAKKHSDSDRHDSEWNDSVVPYSTIPDSGKQENQSSIVSSWE